MARKIIGVAAGLAAWFAVGTLAGVIMRETWPQYVAAARTMTFSLPMMLARLSIGALATIIMGVVTARIARSLFVGVLPGILLLVFFLPEHVMIWQKFPVWYHLTFLLYLIPLTWAGASFTNTRARRRSGVVTPIPS